MRAVILSIIALVLIIAGPALAADVKLQWDPNTETDLAGYRLYQKTDSAEPPFTKIQDIPKGTQTANVTGLDSSHSYSFAVTAYNTAGLESAYSNIVTVSEQLPPTVAIDTQYSNGTTTIVATATDNVGVEKVEIYVDGKLVATQIKAPYAFIWDVSTLTTGVHTIIAKAFDAAGNSGTATKTVQFPVAPAGLKWSLTLTVTGGQ